MKLSVVRHGETIRNIVGLVQGDTESMLSERGKEQAKEVKEKLKNKTFDIVLSSPLSRAYQTAEIITENKIPIIIDERLNERDYGDFEGHTREEFDYVDYWNFDYNLKENNGESVQHLCMRIDDFLRDIKEKYKNKRVLIVTHSGVARAIYYVIQGIPDDGDMSIVDIPNCSIMEYVI